MIRRVLFAAVRASATLADPTRAAAPTLKMVSIDMQGGGGTLYASKGLQGFWKLHASIVDAQLTGDPIFIANLEPAPDHGYNIRLDIARNGRVTVTNGRNGFARTYQVR